METSNINERIEELERLGINIPSSTLRRWASEGLISAPKLVKADGNRHWDWPRQVIEEAAVVYILRHTDLFWSNTTKGWPRTKGNKGETVSTKLLSEVKKLVEHFYASAKKGSFDEGEFNDLFGTLKKVKVPSGGCMFGGCAQHPVFVTWITTLEKIRNNRPLNEAIDVTFHFNNHLTSNPEAPFKLQYDGVSVASSDFENVGVSVWCTPEVEEALLGRKRSDREKAEREGRVILTVDLLSPTLKIEKEDLEKQEIVVTDPMQGLKNVCIDLKKYGLTRCSAEEWAEIEKNWKPVDLSNATCKLVKYNRKID